MTPPFLIDLSHTSHTTARTGVQRVVRSLHQALGARAVPVCFDPYGCAWRPLEDWELANLLPGDPALGRGSRWPLGARARGTFRRISGGNPPLPSASSGLIVPEIFSGETARALPALLRTSPGPHVAIFHDALALQFPELTPSSTVARFPSYLKELLAFDGIAAVSEFSRAALLDYWDWLGLRSTPPVASLPLGIDTPPEFSPVPPGDLPVVLSVGSLAGRKNHLALLEACETLWAGGARFQLRLVGIAHPKTGRAALERIESLRAAGRPVRYDGPVGEDVLESAYRECSFTVYPSLAEGFGLPVAESLARGRPCICRGDGALVETAAGGGCVVVDTALPGELASAIGGLLSSPSALASLETAARGRRFKSWSRYADELVAWMGTLGWHAGK